MITLNPLYIGVVNKASSQMALSIGLTTGAWAANFIPPFYSETGDVAKAFRGLVFPFYLVCVFPYDCGSVYYIL